jgi:uncharacterized protein YjbJ (UPF0337 family)
MSPEETPKKSDENKSNRDILEAQWKQLKGKVKQEWGRLTDDELDQISSRYDELAGLIQERYGYSRDEVDKELDDFLRDFDQRFAGDSTTDAPPPESKKKPKSK